MRYINLRLRPYFTYVLCRSQPSTEEVVPSNKLGVFDKLTVLSYTLLLRLLLPLLISQERNKYFLKRKISLVEFDVCV